MRPMAVARSCKTGSILRSRKTLAIFRVSEPNPLVILRRLLRIARVPLQKIHARIQCVFELCKKYYVYLLHVNGDQHGSPTTDCYPVPAPATQSIFPIHRSIPKRYGSLPGRVNSQE